jgi:trans-aconitate 2-methyltransferase
VLKSVELAERERFENAKTGANMGTWNPQQYLKFRNERTQPSLDLVTRIRMDLPGTIIDIGCGPGNSTQVLHQRWPEAEITGVDNSPEMIEKARKDYPDQKWLLADASKLESDRTFDVVFSNAVLQWIPDHGRLIPRLFDIVHPKGSLAVQVPANNESPVHRALMTVSSRENWSRWTSGCAKLLTYGTAESYYDIISRLSPELELWETIYHHILPSHAEIIEWYKATGMRPFLERLPDDESRKAFEGELLTECKQSYPVQQDGKVIYAFKRIFFVVYKP